MTLSTVLTALYSFCGTVSFFGYLPQIWNLFHDNTRATSISLAAWGWWTFACFVGVLYTSLVIGDLPLILVAIGNGVGCALVFSLAVWRRYAT